MKVPNLLLLLLLLGREEDPEAQEGHEASRLTLTALIAIPTVIQRADHLLLLPAKERKSEKEIVQY